MGPDCSQTRLPTPRTNLNLTGKVNGTNFTSVQIMQTVLDGNSSAAVPALTPNCRDHFLIATLIFVGGVLRRQQRQTDPFWAAHHQRRRNLGLQRLPANIDEQHRLRAQRQRVQTQILNHIHRIHAHNDRSSIFRGRRRRVAGHFSDRNPGPHQRDGKSGRPRRWDLSQKQVWSPTLQREPRPTIMRSVGSVTDSLVSSNKLFKPAKCTDNPATGRTASTSATDRKFSPHP